MGSEKGIAIKVYLTNVNSSRQNNSYTEYNQFTKCNDRLLQGSIYHKIWALNIRCDDGKEFRLLVLF